MTCQSVPTRNLSVNDRRPRKGGISAMTANCLYTLPGWDRAIDEWERWMIAGGLSAATRKTRRAHVRSVARIIGAPNPRTVTGRQLVEVLGTDGYSLEHRRGLRASLVSFFEWCRDSGLVDDDPTVTLPKVRAPAGAPRPATDDIWRGLMDAADTTTQLMARLAGEAGMRRAEVAQVHVDDLGGTSDEPELIVHGKGDKQRVVPISVELAAALRKHADHGFIFPGQVDGHMSPDAVGRRVSAVMPPGWSMHKLRHRFASRGFAATGNLRAVQEALGHASVATTQRYTAVSSRDIRAVSDAVSRPV